MNKICPRFPVVLTASMLAAIFLAFSPASAFAYTCTATIQTPSVVRGESAKVRVDVSGATEPVYVFARAQQGWSSLPLMPLYPIVQSIDGCVKDASFALLGGDSCRDNSLYTKVSAPGGSVTINALTNIIHTDLGSQNFKIFCSTNRPLSNYSEGTGADNAQNTQSLTASYTVTGGGSDCLLTSPVFDTHQLLSPGGFSVTPTARTKTYSIKNEGTATANLAINSATAGVTATLGATTLAGGATTMIAVTVNSTDAHESFNIAASCGGKTYTFSASGGASTPPHDFVGPPPPPPPSNPYGVADGDFPILVAGGPLVITEGQTITRDVYVGNPNGRTAPVKIIAERINLPPGVNITFNPAEGVVTTGQGFKTAATFKADGLLLAGTYKYSLGIDAGFGPSLLFTRNLVMTTKNKVIPAKDAASMPATINTLRTYEAKMLSIRVETPGQTAYPCHPYACLNEYPEVLGKWFMSVKSWTNPVMILDKSHWTTDMGARIYSLADPMHPVHDSSKDLTLDNHWSGDFGGTGMFPGSIGYSRDGKYEISNQWTQGTIGSTKEYPVNGAGTGIPLEGDYHGFDKVDIFESKSHVYWTFLGGFNGGGVNRLDGFKKSAPYLYQQGSTVFDWISPELLGTEPNIPSGGWVGRSVGDTIINTTVMAGAKDYVAVLTSQLGGGPIPKKLSIYVPTENDPVAEIDIKNGATSTRFITNMTSFVTSDVQYVMFMTYLPELPVTAKSGDADYYKNVDDPARIQNQLFVYKFDPKTNLLTKVVEGIKVVGNVGGGTQNNAITGIRVGNKDGVIMLVWDDKTKGDTNPNPAYSGRSFWKPKIFMFSDLAAGKLKDVFADAGYSIVAGNYGAGDAPMMASLNVGVSTYVYINTTRHDIAVLRFGPSGVNVAPVTPPPGGGGGGGPVVTTTPGSGNPPGPEPTAGSCDFTLTPNPASINKTVAQGQSSYISFGLSTTKPVDTTCPAITLSLSTVRDTAGNTVATPLSTSLTISPGNSTVAIYNVNKVPGSYTLPIKAYGRGVQKIIDLELIVQ